MESLKEIIKLLVKKRLDKIELIDENLISNSDSLLTKYYLGLKNEEISTDDEALLYLYGENNALSQQNYRALKSRFKNRIFNTLYFLDLNQSNIQNSYQKVLFEQNKAVQTINILRRNGAVKSTISIIKNNFNIAVIYHLYDIAKIYAFELAKHYAMAGKHNKYKLYREHFDDFAIKENAIQNATLAYYQIQFIIHHSQGRAKTVKQQESLEQLMSELKIYRDLVYSYETEYFFLRSKLFLFEYSGSLDNILEVCQEIERLSTQVQFRQPVWQGVAALYRAKALLSMQKYQEGIECLNEDIHLFNEGGLNWFTAKEYKLKLYMHQLDVLNSERIIQEITKHKSYKHLPEHYKYRFSIYKIYGQLLKDELLTKENKRLRIAKLLNNAQSNVNDKYGFLLSIKIIELVESLRNERFDIFYEKCILLKRYSRQYLSKSNTQREHMLIEMLSKTHQYKNKKELVIEVNKEIFQSLNSNSDLLLLNDYEILPYQFIWQIILKYLQD
ncbi:MAG TPA: hypothetical protein VLZ75_05645 [Chitinophagales bacterium]|nr:hypothetical protein [Chitinophagales bacterium]